MPRFRNAYELMRELVVLSINIVLVKEAIQKTERFKASLLYLNVSTGPMDVLLLDLINRKRSLQNRFKLYYETDLLDFNPARKDLFLVLTSDQAGWKRKEMECGYAYIYDIYDATYIVDLRTGTVYDKTPENVSHFEHRDKKLFMGQVYDYFKIDVKNPVIGRDLRY